jgi:tetratricopeptide (TPR) repeat protein
VLLRLYQATGGAPLAIKWSVGQIKQKGQSLDTVLAALHEAKGDIFEEVFVRSWSLLSEDAQKVLMVMPIFASSASRDAIEAASDVHHFELDEALGQLVQMWLVEVTDELETAKRRYSVHPLTRAFGEAKSALNRIVISKAKKSVVSYYLDFLESTEENKLEYFDYLEIEKENIKRLIYLCFKADHFQEVLELGKKISSFFMIRGYWREIIRYGKIGVNSAEALDDKNSLIIISIDILGWTYLKMDDLDTAESWVKRGLEIATQIKDQERIGVGIRFLGKVAFERYMINDAIKYAKNALSISKKLNYYLLEFHLYSDLGRIRLKQNKYKNAEAEFKKSIEGFKKIKKEDRIISKLAYLGDALFLQDKFDESQSYYNECLSISQKYGRKDTFARAKLGMAKINEKKQ